MEKIYFDYASTTPMDPDVAKAVEPYYFNRFGNPSSPHSFGQEAQKALEDSRKTVAEFIGAKPEEIIFTSGATEGNNHAVLGVAAAYKDRGRHIILSAIEHHSVLEPAERLRKQGFDVTYLTVDEAGCVDPSKVQEAIRPDTILVALIHASNEIGTIQPAAEIGRIVKERNIPFLVDACQTIGHIPVHVDILGASLLTFSAHKFYGPKGIGVLYIRKGVKCDSLLLGGDQELGRRASTQNVSGAVGLAKALLLCREKMEDESRRQIAFRNQLLEKVPQIVHGVKVNGHHTHRLPNNAHFSFDKISGESLLMSLDMAGIAASMGSACTSGALEPSHVLRAIGLPDALAMGSLRISLGRWNTQKDIDFFLEKLPGIIKSLRI